MSLLAVVDSDALNEMCEKVDLLEYAERTMGLEFRRKGDKYFTSCPSHSDSDPSLCIFPDNTFHCFSCGAHGNIINWMMKYEGLSFMSAVKKLSEIVGVDIKTVNICNSYKCFKDLMKMSEIQTDKSVEREILPYEYYDTQFSKETPQLWLDEGISPEAMREYDIRIDEKRKRICYPIYDNEDRLIGVKGRTIYDDYKAHGFSKYMNYTKIQTTDFFVGMKQNRETIKKTQTAIIFEGIKSGLKLATWGEPNNWLAAETKRLNDAQVRILISMGIKNVIIAFDRDVDYKEIKSCTRLLKKFCNVFSVRDRYNRKRLLPGDKDSPVDAGLEIWKTLLEEKVRL